MAFKFVPKTDEEIDMEGLAPEGVYDFETIEAAETISKNSGNPMIKLKIRVFTDNGDRFIYDYLLESFPKKLKHFFRTAGLEKDYETGNVPIEKIKEAKGRVVIKAEPEKVETINGQSKTYRAKNVVVDYGEIGVGVSKTQVELADDDDIPF